MSDQVEFSRSQIQALAEQVASSVVEEMLIKMGIDHTKPLEVQHDFQALREMRVLLIDKEFQADLAHLRKWRQAMDSSVNKGVLTVISLLAAGLISVILLGFEAWMRSRGGP